ncbi:MAG: aldolase/citrate lyase family protein [Chloroflexi bacterium]|nr:aldolase/citrate lyase family protein [Acidobacteriota bacterium]MDA1175221.1 aldolase/citrate lyase family protein [Chloroflexota bacterium]
MKKPAMKFVFGSLLALSLMSIPLAAQGKPATFKNTVKQKLKEGKQVFSHTISSFDIERYCEEAKHYDYTWFEMQHSTMSWGEVEKMMNACPHVGAMPFIRMPDELESSIQKATDVGAIGIIMPTTETAEKAHTTAWFSRYPPVAHRSAGGGNYGSYWDRSTYREHYNDELLIVVMIETPAGVANAYDIANTRGIDVVILGNNDLSSFSGLPQSDPEYQKMLEQVRDATLRAGKIFGNAGAQYREGYSVSKDSFFFQNGPTNDGWVNPRQRGRSVSAVEGESSLEERRNP